MMEYCILSAVAIIALLLLIVLYRRQRREERLNALISSISQEIVLLEDAKSIGRKLKKTLEHTLEVINVTILLYDEDQGDFTFLQDPAKHLSFKDFNTLFLHLEASDTIISRQKIKNTGKDEQLRVDTEKYLNQVNAFLCVPLIFERRLIGLINVGNKKGGQKFTEFDLRVLSSIRRHASVAFTNSLLFDSMSRLFEEGENASERLTEEKRKHNQLVAHLSHELKLPLSLVEGYVRYLQSGRYGQLTEEQEAIVSMMDREIRRLERMVGSLLVYSSMQAETLKPDKDIVALKPLVEECMKEFRADAQEKGIEMHDTTQESHLVVADRDQLKEVLLNLLSNALQFTEKGSVSVRSEEENGHIRVKVQDTGIGIRKDRLSSIFSAHEHRDKGVGKRFSGPGLGLAIVKNLLKAHGTSISVDSEVDKGSTFSFALEAAQER